MIAPDRRELGRFDELFGSRVRAFGRGELRGRIDLAQRRRPADEIEVQSAHDPVLRRLLCRAETELIQSVEPCLIDLGRDDIAPPRSGPALTERLFSEGSHHRRPCVLVAVAGEQVRLAGAVKRDATVGRDARDAIVRG